MTAQQKMHMDDREPILSIMVKPRETIRYTLKHKKFSYSLYVGAICGFASALTALYGTPYPYEYSLGEMVYSSFITGVLYYLLLNVILAALLSALGAVFKGKGTMSYIGGRPAILRPLFSLGTRWKFLFPEQGRDIPRAFPPQHGSAYY